jgi:hypothetical protein
MKVLIVKNGKKMKRKDLIIGLYEQLTQDIGDEINHDDVWERVRSGIYKDIFEQCSQQIPRPTIRQIIGMYRKKQ